ncbi:hypothetical protein BST27_15655 [Mycobacterium intermedium]|uniref:Uncharacterized protein n=1 Tax=Mycobacterium intermedium TaxID=28445 RepID=A0A1E3S853_MYCIE|nr:hypothetical protein [Mycobacterium intermedium]MCV6964211.1 hypothetical protein [Mycobacterium intermedium]ODQ98326.1 hypothetical protein BHQ20_22585 [Mycobacterium intermedium]OPE48680.1 hypothetical protein BV508_17090 [Mycobacterium intermedium]ORB03400.1 hypothetical protein BST27_15655 [Mycobacterium intermedium]
MSWARYEAKALAGASLTDSALHAALEDYVRVQNPHLTDVRLEQATPTEEFDGSDRRWYVVTYLAEDGLAS